MMDIGFTGNGPPRSTQKSIPEGVGGSKTKKIGHFEAYLGPS